MNDILEAYHVRLPSCGLEVRPTVQAKSPLPTCSDGQSVGHQVSLDRLCIEDLLESNVESHL